MAEQVAVREAGPVFEKCHVKAGEAARHATEKHRLAGGVVGGGEMADMVVDDSRRPQRLAPEWNDGAMLSSRHFAHTGS
jgi:hypothetical protein